MTFFSQRVRDVRDAEDVRYLEEGDHARLLAAYYDVVVERCRVRVQGDAADDVAAAVFERLRRELERGRRYTVPYRVVVHGAVSRAIREHRKDHAADVPAEWPELDLTALFGQLPAVDRDVCRLRYVFGKEIDEIAAELGVEHDVVVQALWRAHRRLRELIGAD